MFEEEYQLAEAQDTDYFAVFRHLSPEDADALHRARSLVTELLPEVNEAWDRAEHPEHWLKRMGHYGLLTDGVAVPGQKTTSHLAAGLINMEVSRGDGSLGTIIAVQGGLCVRTLEAFGSDDQKERYLSRMVQGDLPAAFALTEPTHGSDSTSLETSAVRDGDHYILNGKKKWIGNGAAGGITFVWARDEDGTVRAFIVPQESKGYTGRVIPGKISLRAVHQAEITLENVRVPAENMLPKAAGFKDTTKILYASRLGVAWSALGHATAIYEAALAYAQQRDQFGKKIGNFQLVQERLTQMLTDLTAMQLFCVQAATLDADGELVPLQASMAKYHNSRKARQIAQIGRDLLGGNGILLEHHVARHFVDIESVHTYEGTESVQALLIGRDITGFSAFV